MVIDGRRDHSFRIPRPDLTETVGTPNACNDCHADKSARWASGAIDAWFGTPRRPLHFGEALHAARHWAADAGPLLQRVIEDPAQPAIARATALTLLPRQVGPESAAAVQRSATDRDSLVRRAAAEALAGFPAGLRISVGKKLLVDPVRAVRLEVVPVLAGLPPALLDSDSRSSLETAIGQYRATLDYVSDRPEAWQSLGSLEMQLGHFAKAESAFRKALAKEPRFVPAAVSLADLYRGLGKEASAEATLQGVLALVPDSAVAHHALGLSMVRQRRLPESIAQFEAAAALEPDNPDLVYVLAVAVHDAGDVRRAVTILERARARFPSHGEIAAALQAYGAPGK